MRLYYIDRYTPIRHFTDTTILEGLNPTREIKLSASANENYVVQLALLPDNENIIKSIKCNGDCKAYCVNTYIVDKWGEAHTASIALTMGTIQPIFFVIPADKANANSTRDIDISMLTDKGVEHLTLHMTFSDAPVDNNGCDDIHSLARLDWLNSSRFIDNNVVPPYTMPVVDSNTISILGRDITIGENGLPSQVTYHFDEGIGLNDDIENKLLASPMTFDILDNMRYDTPTISQDMGVVDIRTSASNDTMDIDVHGRLTFEGAMDYSILISAKKDITLPNIALSSCIASSCATYMNGLGAVGGTTHSLDFKWSAQYNRDCLYIGAMGAGMRIKWKAEDYVKPLVNIYYHNLPLNVPTLTWDNNGNGNIVVDKANDVSVTANTGIFTLKKDEKYNFAFELHFVPFKPIDWTKHYATRYYHNYHIGNELKACDEAASRHLTHMVIHHGNMVHPFINYPFIEVDRLKNLVEYAGVRNIGVKVYYTTREHSNHMAEVFVYKALGDEIILRRKGQGYNWGRGTDKWLREYFGEKIIPAWRVKYTHGKYRHDNDVSFIVRPNSRLDNYYIEGLDYLVKNIGIKGIYIDDTALDRTTILRARKVLNQNDGLIDMHMWNHEDDRAGNVSCMNLYTEIFPFLDSLWIGEGYPYKKLSPEYILTEVSGLPYGQTSQMLQGGGNPYIGMLYAMNNRYGWGVKNAHKIYALWDMFHIETSTMFGYWHSKNPARVDDESVKLTTYVHENTAMLCLFNFGNRSTRVNINIDDASLGFTPNNAYEYKINSAKMKAIDMKKSVKLGAKDGMIIIIK